MLISLGKNLDIVETDDNFINDFESNYEVAYNYVHTKYPNPSGNISLYDVLMSFASFVTITVTGKPSNSTFEWYLPNGISTEIHETAIKDSLVPYVLTFNNGGKYINSVRASDNVIINARNLSPNTITLTINPTPADATVTLTIDGSNPFDFHQVGNTIEVSPGTRVIYTVSKTDYITQSETIIVNEESTVDIILSKTLYTYTIHPTPSNAIVTLTANGYSQIGNSISVPKDTIVSWSVSKSNYATQSGTKTITDNIADNITLRELLSFTITPTPSNATVTLIATGYSQTGNSILVPYGTTVVWMVEKEGYVTRSGSKIVVESMEAQITLSGMYIYTINPTPSDSIVTLTAEGYVQEGNSIEVPSGTIVTWKVEREGYGTEIGKKNVTATTTDNIELLKYQTYTINPTPSNATVELTADGFIQEGNSITVLYGTRVHWKVYKSGYMPQAGYTEVTTNRTDSVVLGQSATLTINPTPSDANVIITAEGYGQTGNSIIVPVNTRVYWSVTKIGYVGQYGTQIMSTNETKNITLIPS